MTFKLLFTIWFYVGSSMRIQSINLKKIKKTQKKLILKILIQNKYTPILVYQPLTRHEIV